MRRIDEKTVELDEREEAAYELFHDYLDSGVDCIAAQETIVFRFPGLHQEFLDYLVS